MSNSKVDPVFQAAARERETLCSISRQLLTSTFIFIGTVATTADRKFISLVTQICWGLLHVDLWQGIHLYVVFGKGFIYMLCAGLWPSVHLHAVLWSLAWGLFTCCVLVFGLGSIYMLCSGLWQGVHLHVVFWSLALGPFTCCVLVFGMGSIYMLCSGLWPGVHLVNAPL